MCGLRGRLIRVGGESGWWEKMKVWREREGGELSVVLCSDRLSCVASLQHFTALAVPETDPPSLPPSPLSSHLPALPLVISPPLCSCRPSTFSPFSLSTPPSFSSLNPLPSHPSRSLTSTPPLIGVMSSFAPPFFHTKRPRSPCPEVCVCSTVVDMQGCTCACISSCLHAFLF